MAHNWCQNITEIGHFDIYKFKFLEYLFLEKSHKKLKYFENTSGPNGLSAKLLVWFWKKEPNLLE